MDAGVHRQTSLRREVLRRAFHQRLMETPPGFGLGPPPGGGMHEVLRGGNAGDPISDIHGDEDAVFPSSHSLSPAAAKHSAAQARLVSPKASRLSRYMRTANHALNDLYAAVATPAATMCLYFILATWIALAGSPVGGVFQVPAPLLLSAGMWASHAYAARASVAHLATTSSNASRTRASQALPGSQVLLRAVPDDVMSQTTLRAHAAQLGACVFACLTGLAAAQHLIASDRSWFAATIPRYAGFTVACCVAVAVAIVSATVVSIRRWRAAFREWNMVWLGDARAYMTHHVANAMSAQSHSTGAESRDAQASTNARDGSPSSLQKASAQLTFASVPLAELVILLALVRVFVVAPLTVGIDAAVLISATVAVCLMPLSTKDQDGSVPDAARQRAECIKRDSDPGNAGRNTNELTHPFRRRTRTLVTNLVSTITSQQARGPLMVSFLGVASLAELAQLPAAACTIVPCACGVLAGALAVHTLLDAVLDLHACDVGGHAVYARSSRLHISMDVVKTAERAGTVTTDSHGGSALELRLRARELAQEMSQPASIPSAPQLSPAHATPASKRSDDSNNDMLPRLDSSVGLMWAAGFLVQTLLERAMIQSVAADVANGNDAHDEAVSLLPTATVFPWVVVLGYVHTMSVALVAFLGGLAAHDRAADSPDAHML